MYLEIDLLGCVNTATFKTYTSRVLVIAAPMAPDEYNATGLVIPGVFQFRHFTASHLLDGFGERFVIREVNVVAPQVVEIFGERFFGQAQNL